MNKDHEKLIKKPVKTLALRKMWHKKYALESVSDIKISDNKGCRGNANCFFLPTILKRSQIQICDACLSNGHGWKLKLDLLIYKTI